MKVELCTVLILTSGNLYSMLLNCLEYALKLWRVILYSLELWRVKLYALELLKVTLFALNLWRVILYALNLWRSVFLISGELYSMLLNS